MNFKAISMIKSAVAVALLGAASVTAVADSYDMKGKDVLSVAKQQGKFNTLAKAIEVAGLQDALTAQGPVTIFAPTDEAFAKLPPEQLEALLKPENKDKLVQILTNQRDRGRPGADPELIGFLQRTRDPRMGRQQGCCEGNFDSPRNAGRGHPPSGGTF